MLNYNGQIISKDDSKLSYQNRAFKYGDAVFDTLKYKNGAIVFIEDHYFRLMSSMRMLRMGIPMNFTLKFYRDEILKLVNKKDLPGNSRVRVTVFRKDGGLYAPQNNEINYLIETESLISRSLKTYEIELFKDFQVYSGVLSTIKTNNRMINVIASIFASENEFQNCVLINEKKNIVEAINANIFLIKGKDIFTPALSEGCINGVFRKKIIELLSNTEEYNIHETSVSPFELLRAEEVFLSNSITEIQSVSKYRKKNYTNDKTLKIIKLLDQVC